MSEKSNNNNSLTINDDVIFQASFNDIDISNSKEKNMFDGFELDDETVRLAKSKEIEVLGEINFDEILETIQAKADIKKPIGKKEEAIYQVMIFGKESYVMNPITKTFCLKEDDLGLNLLIDYAINDYVDYLSIEPNQTISFNKRRGFIEDMLYGWKVKRLNKYTGKSFQMERDGMYLMQVPSNIEQLINIYDKSEASLKSLSMLINSLGSKHKSITKHIHFWLNSDLKNIVLSVNNLYVNDNWIAMLENEDSMMKFLTNELHSIIQSKNRIGVGCHLRSIKTNNNILHYMHFNLKMTTLGCYIKSTLDSGRNEKSDDFDLVFKEVTSFDLTIDQKISSQKKREKARDRRKVNRVDIDEFAKTAKKDIRAIDDLINQSQSIFAMNNRAANRG